MNLRQDAPNSPRSPEIGEHLSYGKKTIFDGTNPPVVVTHPTTTTDGMDCPIEGVHAGTDLKKSSTAFTYCGSLGALK